MSYSSLRPPMRPRDGSVRPLYHTGSIAQSVTHLHVGRDGGRLVTTDRVVALGAVAMIAKLSRVAVLATHHPEHCDQAWIISEEIAIAGRRQRRSARKNVARKHDGSSLRAARTLDDDGRRWIDRRHRHGRRAEPRRRRADLTLLGGPRRRGEHLAPERKPDVVPRCFGSSSARRPCRRSLLGPRLRDDRASSLRRVHWAEPARCLRDGGGRRSARRSRRRNVSQVAAAPIDAVPE